MKHLFTDGTDTFIAEDAAGAMTAWEDHTGCFDASIKWEMIPDDKNVTVYFEDEIKAEYLPVNRIRVDIPEDERDDIWTHFITAKAGDWANCGWEFEMLCSTEY